MYLCKLFSLMKIKFNHIEIENNIQRVVIKKQSERETCIEESLLIKVLFSEKSDCLIRDCFIHWTSFGQWQSADWCKDYVWAILANHVLMCFQSRLDIILIGKYQERAAILCGVANVQFQSCTTSDWKPRDYMNCQLMLFLSIKSRVDSPL